MNIKYASKRYILGTAGSLILTVFICLCAYILDGSSVVKAVDKLPLIETDREIRYADATDSIVSFSGGNIDGEKVDKVKQTISMAGQNSVLTSVCNILNEERSKYGNGDISGSTVLSRSGLYRSMYMLSKSAYGDVSSFVINTPSTVYNGGVLVNKQLSETFPHLSAEICIPLMDRIDCDSANALSVYIARSLLNLVKTRNTVISSSTRSIGIGIARADIDGRSIILVVIHTSASADIPADGDSVPENILVYSDEAFVYNCDDIYVIKGSTLQDSTIAEAIHEMKNRVFTAEYDLSEVDVSTLGEYTLNIIFTDNDENTQTVGMKVHVVNGTPPGIRNDSIDLPVTDTGDIYDISRYIYAYDETGIRSITAEPCAVKYGDTGEITVKVVNNVGVETVKVLPIKYIETVYSDAVRSDNATGLACSVAVSDGGIFEDMHTVITCKQLDGALSYSFTVLYEDEFSFTLNRNVGSFIWNPYVKGEYTIFCTVLGEKQSVLAQDILHISVAEKEELMYNDPVLGFSDDSPFRVDYQKGIVTGIEPMTKVSLFIQSIKILNTGSEGYTVSVYAYGSNELVPEENDIGTGMRAVIYDDSKVYSEYSILIYGDVTGDGNINIGDFAKMRQHLLQGNIISGIYEMAGLITTGDKITIGDYAKMRQYLLNNAQITQ